MIKEKNIAEFNADVNTNDGYIYTTNNKLSSVIANHRISDAIISMADLKGKRVIDIGCGDGVFSIELLKAGALEVVGVDAAENAIRCAQKNSEGLEGIKFKETDIYRLDISEKRYDVAIVRGVLHHLYYVNDAIGVISRMAEEIIILEPNGFNPVLKILEKISPYHVEHEEKSYAPTHLNRWFESCGGKVISSQYIGLVPYFCPDYLARFLKKLEWIVEALPGVRKFCCGQYLLKIKAG